MTWEIYWYVLNNLEPFKEQSYIVVSGPTSPPPPTPMVKLESRDKRVLGKCSVAGCTFSYVVYSLVGW